MTTESNGATLTIFTFGDWGWGGATAELVRIVDLVERSRGSAAPMFVDIRVRRAVRAVGFRGDAFEKRVGSDRYRWMRSLGNRLARDTGGLVDLVDPGAVGDLLDLAVACRARRQRLLFFCACEFPGVEGDASCCHRAVVARLLTEEARRRRLDAEILEWPGGDPIENGLQVSVRPHVFEGIASPRPARRTVPLGSVGDADLATFGSIPHGSLVRVHCDEANLPSQQMVTSPARYRNNSWSLPVFRMCDIETATARSLADDWRRARGISRRISND